MDYSLIEFWGKPPIHKHVLMHGEYYFGNCRNATVARWNEHEQCFYYWETKLGTTFLETIKHRSDDTIFDVFDAYILIHSRQVGKHIPLRIENDVSLNLNIKFW